MFRSFSAVPLRQFARRVPGDDLIDVALILLLVALAFASSFHPFFFGDELVAYELASVSDSVFGIFQGLNANKPRLVFNAVEAVLARIDAARALHVMLVAACMAWINVLIFLVARHLFAASRTLAWLLVLGVLSSRYGVMLYFDYLSGLIETLSTALFLSAALLAWLACRQDFKRWLAAGALVAAILTGLVHERYMVATLALGCALAVREYLGAEALRRHAVLGWALALAILPFGIYWLAIQLSGALPITTVGGDQRVAISVDTLWAALTYGYDVLLGGNYGHEWYWGRYNHLHPTGRWLGALAAFVTAAIAFGALVRRGYAERGLAIALGLGAPIAALIAVASLAGTVRQEARFMFPVGVLVLLAWFLVLRSTWRHLALGLILATNLVYLALASHDSMMYVYSSRAAHALANALLTVKPVGADGIVVGNPDDIFTIGGGSEWNPANRRRGATYSRVNLRSAVHVDPHVEDEVIDGSVYDFGLVFDGFGAHRTAQYRLASMDTVLRTTGAIGMDDLPVRLSLGGAQGWSGWEGSTAAAPGALQLAPGAAARLSLAARDLDERWLVVRARALEEAQVPLRLEINWHAQDQRYLGTTARVLTATAATDTHATLLHAPPGAELAHLSVTMIGAGGALELQAVDLK